MTGDEDFGNSPEMARKAAGKVPGADCVILPGLRHMALAEDPTAVLRALLPFLTRTYHHLPA
jgi:pimeloyl-ACP methyl ester carboxylesterase